MLNYGASEEIVKISDYNKVAKLYGTEQYELKDDEYIVLCDYDNMAEIRNQVLSEGEHELTIAVKKYKYAKCKNGYIEMAASHINTGIILVPDNCQLTEDMKEENFLVANYNVETEKEKEEIEKIFTDNDNSILLQNLDNKQRYFMEHISWLHILEVKILLRRNRYVWNL